MLDGIVERADGGEAPVAGRREFVGDPAYTLHEVDRYPLIAGQDWAAGDLWTLFDWAARSEAVRARIVQIAEAGEPEGLRIHAATLLLALSSGEAAINANTSFEEGPGTPAAGWTQWLQDAVGTLALSEEAAHSGQWGLVGTGIQYGGPMQFFPSSPGATAWSRV